MMSNQKPRCKPLIIQQCEAIDYGVRMLQEGFPTFTEAEAKIESNRFLGVLERDAKIDAEIINTMIPEFFRVMMFERMQRQAERGEVIDAAIDEQATPAH